MVENLMKLERHTETLLEGLGALSSPALVFSLPQLRKNCLTLEGLCNSILGRGRFRAFFPLKVAPRFELARVVSEHGVGLEIINERERLLAERCGANDFILSGNVKTEELLTSAMRAGCRFVVCESPGEVAKVDKIAAKLDVEQDILLRLKLTPYRRLGMSLEQAVDISRNASRHPRCRVVGLHVHPGSNVSAEIARKTISVVRSAAAEFAKANGGIEFLNFGSGLPAMSIGHDELGARLTAFGELAEDHGAMVLFEPGRPLVGDAAVLVATVTEVRPQDRQLSIDTAAYVLPGPCRADPVLFLRRRTSPKLELITVREPKEGALRICGIWPAEGDSLWVDGISDCDVGDWIIFPQAGAYSLGFMHELSFDEFAPQLVGN